MSRFGSLGIDGIRQIGSDQAAVQRLMHSVQVTIGELLKLVENKFVKDARLSPKDIGDLFERMDDLMSARHQSFAAIRKAVQATRVRPKGEKRETIYLSLMHQPEIRCYHLTSLRLTGTSRKLGYIFMMLPFAISEHAVQRVLERVPGQQEALKLITESMIDWMVHLIPLLHVAHQRNDNYMGIPVSERSGMLYGEFVPAETADCAFGFICDNRGATPIQPNLPLINGPTFLIKTFVPTAKLRPEQALTMERMDAYQQDNRIVADEFRNVLFWPDAQLINQDLPENHKEQAQALSDDFGKLFNDPLLLKGLTRSRDYEISAFSTDFTKIPLIGTPR